MKNIPKNNGSSQIGLFHPSPSVKPIAADFATAIQLVAAFPFLGGRGVDDTFLRNRAREINPRTNAPWIPKPRSNQYEITPTILGLFEWFLTRPTSTGVPAYYDSMQSLENSPLGVPKEFTRWALKNGCGEAAIGGSRINPLPILAKAAEILRQIASGNISGIDGMEVLNKDQELAKNIRLQSEKLEDEKLLRRGDLLMSRDGTWAVTQLQADEYLWDKRDQPLRTLLITTPKTINRQHRTLLKNSGVADPIISKCAAITLAAINTVLEKLRAKIPKPITAKENEEA